MAFLAERRQSIILVLPESAENTKEREIERALPPKRSNCNISLVALVVSLNLASCFSRNLGGRRFGHLSWVITFARTKPDSINLQLY